jgi:YbbR domain-containing protein
VDVSKIYEPGTYELRYSTSYGDVPSSAITVLSKEPGTVKVVVEEKLTKSIPVKVIYSGTVAENYMADMENADLSAENVTISGPKTVIDKITMARVDVNLNNHSESLNERFPITLCDANSQPVDAQKVVTDVAEVTLNLRVVRVKKLALTPNIIYGGGATKENTTVTISPTEIQISGSDAQLEKLNELKFDVDLSTVSVDGDLKYAITLPEGIANETGVSEATVHISFNGLATKTLTVTKFSVVNKPEGYNVTLITQALEVQLRGPADVIAALKASDVTVVVDLASITQGGTVKVKATITCEDAAVGAIYDPEKPYMVSATIS